MYRLETSAARPLARFLAYRGSGDGRLVVLGALAFYLAAVTVASFVWHVDLWPWLGVPPGPAIFFDTTRLLTLLAMFSRPAYGGNRDGVGWKLIGFEDRHFFRPPFGYYDRGYPGFVIEGAKRL